MIPENLPRQVLLHRSQNTYLTHLKRLLENWQIEIFEASVRAEYRDTGILDSVPVALALVSEEDFSGIDFLRSIMHSNNWIQRFMLSAPAKTELYMRAVNKAHINYLLTLPPEAASLATYLSKAQRRYENLTRPFAKFDALTDIAEELLLDNQKFRLEANTDALTQLMNRRSFNNIFQKIWQKYKQKGIDFSLAILDIDHFKKVNDMYGHASGDLVLKNLGDILLSNQRMGIDYAFRYGGEEFALISLNSNGKEMKGYVERLLRMVRNTVVKDKGNFIRITFSAGVSQSRDDGSPEKIIDFADKALYRAKQSGRNCVVVYTPV